MSNLLIRQSERIYDLLLSFYPESYKHQFGEEMKYVFSESLKEALVESKESGIVSFWTRTIIDTGKSLTVQHIDNMKGGGFMKKNNDIIMQNKVFLWIAAGTGMILSIPLMAMLFKLGFDWGIFDFLIMGIHLFGAGSVFVLIARVTPRKYRVLVAVAVMAALLLTWVHLAVGIVDTWPLAGS